MLPVSYVKVAFNCAAGVMSKRDWLSSNSSSYAATQRVYSAVRAAIAESLSCAGFTAVDFEHCDTASTLGNECKAVISRAGLVSSVPVVLCD